MGNRGLNALPPLPPALECLDLRGCRDLETLPASPESLETLVLDGCVELREIPNLEATSFRILTELSLNGCKSLPEVTIHNLLKIAPALRTFFSSDCPKITRISTWPSGLVDARLNQCAALKALPARWPPRLRRLELSGAKSIARLPDFPETLDYIDLTGMERLRNLPAKRGHPRTLFLHGAGLLMPPASELGETAQENVAARTEAYFQDVALTGRGEMKRCKLLMLGNGGAGKTCLSLALVPGGDPAQAVVLGSTHAVQFWDWRFQANVEGSMDQVRLHVRDFGGQEIYHNTHRLFMSKGAVFVVLWNPDQDGKQPPPAECAAHFLGNPIPKAQRAALTRKARGRAQRRPGKDSR